MKVLVTGAAGFIGSNLVMKLLKTEPAVQVVGLDSVNDYYDVSLKEFRLRQIEALATEHTDCTWRFVKGNLADRELINKLFADEKFDIVVNLAAQAIHVRGHRDTQADPFPREGEGNDPGGCFKGACRPQGKRLQECQGTRLPQGNPGPTCGYQAVIISKKLRIFVFRI